MSLEGAVCFQGIKASWDFQGIDMRVWGYGFAASCGGMAKAKRRLGAECRWRTTGETAPRCFGPWRLWEGKKEKKPSSRRLASGQASAFPTGWILGRLLPAELSPSLAKLFLLCSARPRWRKGKPWVEVHLAKGKCGVVSRQCLSRMKAETGAVENPVPFPFWAGWV